MNPLKKLAGQTAIYGLSTIIGRLLNYLLVPLWTYRFANPADFGVTTEFYAYTTFLNVVLTYGMETALFNFSAKNQNNPAVFRTALFSLLLSSALFLAGMITFAQPIAEFLRYPNHVNYVIWMSWIIGLDALAAVPFAKLRQQQRAKRFALLKTLNILINIVGNVFFIGLCKWAYDADVPGWLEWSAQFYDPAIGIGYVFIANLIASALTLVLLLPEIIAGLGRPDFALWKRMLVYALPLLVAGLAGMVNETMSRILLKYLLPIESAMEALGIYGACYKMSILMTLFIQAFRYAAEPFFFAHYQQSDARELYAVVMRWFVIACSLIFLGVMQNIAWMQYFVGANYRSGLGVVPILLMANLCLGVFFNLSIWYKLTEQTRFGTYLTLWGSVVTLSLDFYSIPRWGFMGSAWATLVCYGSMAVLSYVLGQKFYKIPYDLQRMVGYPLLAAAIFLWGAKIGGMSVAMELVAKNGLVLMFLAVIFVLERKPRRRANAGR